LRFSTGAPEQVRTWPACPQAVQPRTKARSVAPVHPARTLKEPLLRAVVRDAALAVEEYIELFDLKPQCQAAAIGQALRVRL
jgi:hypothetical protein